MAPLRGNKNASGGSPGNQESHFIRSRVFQFSVAAFILSLSLSGLLVNVLLGLGDLNAIKKDHVIKRRAMFCLLGIFLLFQVLIGSLIVGCGKIKSLRKTDDRKTGSGKRK